MADSEQNGLLTARQYNAISALMTEPTVRKACEVSHTPERTMYKWLKDKPFVGEYRAARREAVTQAIARLQSASGAAVGVLLRLMVNARSEAVKLGAASKIIDTAIESVTLEDLMLRIQALEERMDG